MQTIAVGRAYEISRFGWPKHAFYVRVRIDDLGWCLPPVYQVNALRHLAVNYVHHATSKGKRWKFASDRYVVAPEGRKADTYFNAWMIWEHVCCSHPCFAGGGSCDAPPVFHANHSTGECALHAWMTRPGNRHLAWKQVRGPGRGIFRYYNDTFVIPSMDATWAWERLRKNRPLPVRLDALVQARAGGRRANRKACTIY